MLFTAFFARPFGTPTFDKTSDPASSTAESTLSRDVMEDDFSLSADNLKDKTFVLTGTIPNYSRKEMGALIESHGGKIVGTVSKKTDYIVAGDDPGSKYDKGKALDIRILSEEEVLELIHGKEIE